MAIDIVQFPAREAPTRPICHPIQSFPTAWPATAKLIIGPIEQNLPTPRVPVAQVRPDPSRSSAQPTLFPVPELPARPAGRPVEMSYNRQLPEPNRFARVIGRGLVEVVVGRRSVFAVTRWISDDVLRVLQLGAATAKVNYQDRLVIHSARVQIDHHFDASLGARRYHLEVCVHAEVGAYRLLLAFRLVEFGVRWMCSELEILSPRVRRRARRNSLAA